MTPQAALDYQIKRYRKMTGEERLAIALGMHEHECDTVRASIQAQHPDIERSEVERLFRRRISAARSFGGERAVEGIFDEAKKHRT